MSKVAQDDGALNELEGCRKALVKSKPDSLVDGVLLTQGVDLALRPCPPAAQLKLLELALATLRQLIAVLALPEQPQRLLALVEEQISPALQPGAILANLVIVNLEHPQKVQQTRATELLSAAGKLSTLIPSPAPSTSSSNTQTFMIPFFKQAVSSGLSRRSNLAAISALLPFTPQSSMPSALLTDLLQDLVIVDAANIRCTLIVDLLVRSTYSLSSQEEKARAVLDPLVPRFDPSQPHSALNNLNRYLLPALFKADPAHVTVLLDILSTRPELFAAWVTVASLGVSSGLVKIEDLPSKDLHDALAHEDADVRIRAFELVSGAKAEFTPGVMELIKEGFRWNDSLPSAGSRSSFSSSTYAFLVRLHQLETSTRRVFRKKLTPAVEAEQASLSHVISLSSSFREWFLTSYLDEGLRQARRAPVFRILLALNLLDRYLEVFGQTGETQQQVFTEDRVDLLLACQMSEFTEVRSRARKILESATITLPGYESLSTPKAQALLSSALASLNLPRKTQAEAGKSALCILFGKLARKETDPEEALAFVTDLVDRLDNGVEAVEKNLVKGIEEHPLHGSLAAVGDLLLCLDLSSASVQAMWRPLFHRLYSLVNRIWTVTRTVISLAPSKVEGALDSSRPDHEIARAYEVMGGDDAEGDNEESMDHTGLLSGCWRATRNAGELLAVILSLPISKSGANQQVWSRDEVNQAGERFLTWMHEIRHRGTFSKIASAFAQVVEVVRPVPELRGLCDQWLQHELTSISSDQHSTTRRSAALPYSILSLVSSDTSLLDTALTSLLELARVGNANTSNVTKVHAFNVLKIVLLDARQAKVFGQWFERGVMTALGAFESSDWNVRNVGLILFSTLVHRCLSPPRGGQDYYRSRSTLATRPSFTSFHTKYPLVIPFITKYLRQSQDTSGANRHSPLFPLLIIVRSLRWSEDEVALQEQLREAVAPYLSSREYQVRQVAAQAFSSLLSPSQALDKASFALAHRSHLAQNAVHGNFLLIHQLISNVIQWNEVASPAKREIENGLIDSTREHVPGSCPPITQAVLSCVAGYLANTEPTSVDLVDHVFSRASEYLIPKTKDIKDGFVPAEESGRSACTSLLVSHRPSEELLQQLLSSTEDDQILVFERLPSLPSLWNAKVFGRVLDLAITGKGGSGVQVLALDALSEIGWSDEALVGVRGKWDGVVAHMERLSGSKCVPVKEAALVALGWAVHQTLVQGGQGESERLLGTIEKRILIASHEDESQPTRFAAFKSLSHLTPHIFSCPTPDLTRSLIRLVQDDDEEIRLGAGEIIVTGLGGKRGVVQSRAVEMVWAWTRECLGRLGVEQRDEWVGWIAELARDRNGLDHDLKLLGSEQSSDVLFEVEASNIFRDPLVDVHFANVALSSLGGSTNLQPVIAESRAALAAQTMVHALVSPIDDTWEARRTIRRRLDCQTGLSTSG